MKSKIEIRIFSVEQAVTILGAGTPAKDVVAKAKEIENYVVGEAEIPEVENEKELIDNIMNAVVEKFGAIGELTGAEK